MIDKVKRWLYFSSVAFNDQGPYVLSDHERQLIQEYSLKEGLPEGAGGGSLTKDVYEKAIPKHGDLWFHKFVSVMQHNPGHVIRLFLLD